MLEADLHTEYGIDLNDLGSHRLTWRKLNVLVAQLPRTSRLATALHGPPARWGELEHMLADLWDLLAAANTEQGKRAPTYPRPKKPKRALLSPKELDRRLLALRDRG